MFKRYHIQACSLDIAVRKSQIKWQVVGKAYSLEGAKEKMRHMEQYTTDLNTVYRVVDSKTGKPVA